MKEDWSSEENVWRCTGLRSTRVGRTTSSSTQHLIAAPIDVGFFRCRWQAPLVAFALHDYPGTQPAGL